MNEERIILSAEQAIQLLPPGDMVHTFYSVPNILIGGDHEREELIGDIKKFRCEIAGPAACKMDHGLVVMTDHGPLFVQTDPDELAKYYNPLTVP